MRAAADPPSKPVTGRRCVLVVEDNPLNMKLFCAMIGAQGHEVLQAGTGSRALALARRRHPDLIIMDLQLPDMSGLDVTRELKSADDTHAIPIIATTAYATQGDEEVIRAGGCDGYMAKPIAISEFLALIESVIVPADCAPA
jgi:two-component system, cell cycle response regulator DivK